MTNFLELRKKHFQVATIGDDLDYQSTLYDSNGRELSTLEWGFSSGWIPSESEIEQELFRLWRNKNEE